MQAFDNLNSKSLTWHVNNVTCQVWPQDIYSSLVRIVKEHLEIQHWLMNSIRKGHTDYFRMMKKGAEDQVVGLKEPGIHNKFSSKPIAAPWLLK